MKFSLQHLRSKLRFEDRLSRIIVIVLLLAVIGAAGYWGVIATLAGRHRDAAAAALDRYDYDEASEHLKKYLALRPADPMILLSAAQTARRRGKFEEAVNFMGQAQKHGAPAVALDVEGQLLSVQQGDLGHVARLASFCAEQPDSPDAALILEAIIEGSLRASNFKLAKWAVEQWLAHCPGKFAQAQGLVWRGRMNVNSPNVVPSPHDDFRQALELFPEHYQARLWLATWLNVTEPRQALPHLEALRRRRPDDVEVRFQIARLHRNLAEPEEAKRLLDELLAEDPSNKVIVLVERGRVALDLNRPRDAEYFLLAAKSLGRTPRRDVLMAMADCLRQLNRLEEAKAYQDQVKELDAKTDIAAKELKERRPDSP